MEQQVAEIHFDELALEPEESPPIESGDPHGILKKADPEPDGDTEATDTKG